MYITTEFLNDRLKCDYLDFNTQPSSDMLLNCVQDKSRGYDMKCQKRYDSSYDLDRVNDNLVIKRGVSEGKGNIKEKYNGIEGFTDKIFITDNGPGESTIPFGECPEGYSFNENNGSCVQVCHACKYRDNMKSQQFNEADPCFPNGVYDGLTNEGNINCSSV